MDRTGIDRLPQTDHCCWCVPDLRTATIIIAVITLCCGIDSVYHPAFKSYCKRFTAGHGWFIMLWYLFLYIILWAYTVACGILLYSAIRHDPIVRVFIYTQLAAIALNVSLGVFHLVRYYHMDVSKRCFRISKTGGVTGEGDAISYLFWGIVGGLFGFYCCIVVNSYAFVA